MEENKYKAALERAKSAIKECGGNVGRIKMIESIFPELAESKEENIRKSILMMFKKALPDVFNRYGMYKNDAIAYMEKLKDIDKRLEDAYKTADEVQYKRGYDDGYLEGIGNAKKELEKQGEQEQLTHSQVTKKSDKVWNEDDEKNLQGVIDEIQANKSSAPEYDLKTYDKFLSWLKSIKERVQPQPKQVEWSEEDEEMKDLIDEISCQNDDVDYETHVRITRWLNELKQRLS